MSSFGFRINSSNFTHSYRVHPLIAIVKKNSILFCCVLLLSFFTAKVLSQSILAWIDPASTLQCQLAEEDQAENSEKKEFDKDEIKGNLHPRVSDLNYFTTNLTPIILENTHIQLLYHFSLPEIPPELV